MPILRTALIALSHSRAIQDLIVRVPVSRRMARRFVAGETLAEAIAAVLNLNRQGMLATLDHLGENVSSEAEAIAAADEYLRALDALHIAAAASNMYPLNNLGSRRSQTACEPAFRGSATPAVPHFLRRYSNISVKLTQMGLDLGDDFCYANVSRVIRKAAALGNFVRVDMEGAPYTARTLALYRRLREDHNNVGIVIQAYLHRSRADIEALIAEGSGHFRLCKGAYDEPAAIAFREPSRVTQALTELVRICLASAGQAVGAYAGIATHDEEVINFARAYAYQHEIPPTAYEFQMLYGIRRELQTDLMRRGYQMRVYVPYGTHWYPYFMRRLAERPANLLFFLRALVGD